jgi:hypothetical protein
MLKVTLLCTVVLIASLQTMRQGPTTNSLVSGDVVCNEMLGTVFGGESADPHGNPFCDGCAVRTVYSECRTGIGGDFDFLDPCGSCVTQSRGCATTSIEYFGTTAAKIFLQDAHPSDDRIPVYESSICRWEFECVTAAPIEGKACLEGGCKVPQFGGGGFTECEKCERGDFLQAKMVPTEYCLACP